MNILKSRYSELNSMIRLIPNMDSNKKELCRGIYITQRMTSLQEQRWKEIIEKKHIFYDNQTFLYNLLFTCQMKNRSNLILTNIDMKNRKLSKLTFQYEDYVYGNCFISHICLSNSWIKRREKINNDALIYLLSEFTLFECLSRKRQLFIQIAGTHETFFHLPYYIRRKSSERKNVSIRLDKSNKRKRIIQFHLNATKQGQQAHLTDLCEKLIPRNMMHYHVSKFERFDKHHPIETSASGYQFVDTIFNSNFSKNLLNHRPKQEWEQIRENLAPIFDKFRLNHLQLYLRRRSRLPFAYTQHHIPEPTATLDQLIPLTTPVSVVQNFVRIWLTRVLPIELFGTKYNFQLFVRKMSFIIQLPRTQQYSLGDAIRKLKLSKFNWTYTDNNSCSLVRQLYICHLIYYLVEYVLLLIRSYFYVTEASSPSHPLVFVFYRQKIWHVIQRKSHKDLIEKSCSPTVQQQFTENFDEIGYLWIIRFVPKTTGVRYLACAQEQMNIKDNLNHLKYTNEVLKYLRRHNPHLMGISTFNRTEMHKRWQDYCRLASKPEDDDMIYFLRSDVSNFYDSINLDYLNQALIEFLDNCQFDYNLHIHTMCKTQYRNGRLIRKRIVYWIGKENEQMCETMMNDTKHQSNGIFHDMIIHNGHIEIYNKTKLLKYIRAQLYNSQLYTRHYKTKPTKTYSRTVGINHGLPIASMLGQIYLNKIDRDIDFSPLDDEFAVRHEDDLLIITPHRYRLRRIQYNMMKKLNELHNIVNPLTHSLKTKTNIRHKNMNKFRPVDYWGSLVDIRSREIIVSINPNEDIKKKINNLTIKVTRETGYHLRHSLLNALCLRSHSYYFDRLYTSDQTLVKNFFFLSCYFLRRLCSMCVRFQQIYSDKYVQSKSLFLFRTMRSGLRMLIKKAFINSDKNNKSTRLINQCKYVFYLTVIRLAKINQHLFNKVIILRRFSHMIKNLKYLNKRLKYNIKKMLNFKHL